jgi:Leucine-rich repeat (LRR) protein
MHARVWGLVSLIIVLSLFWSCSKMGGGGNDADDGNSPFVILDLRVSAVTDTTVTLKWTATGDDTSAGTAFQYDMRISREFITQDNWTDATQLTGEPAPSPSGQTDSMEVTGLLRDSTYYFALNACDEAGNCSGPSNCTQATCFTDYIITFPDSNLEAAIRRQISKPSGDIHRIDIMNLTFLDANEVGISSLTGLENCINLTVIFMSNNPISDLEPIAGLWRLNTIQFTGDNISDISPIAGLTNLEAFSFRSNPLSDISVLSGLPNLHIMELSQIQATDLAPLVANNGIAERDTIYLYNNPQLSQEAINVQIPALEARGVTVIR